MCSLNEATISRYRSSGMLGVPATPGAAVSGSLAGGGATAPAMRAAISWSAATASWYPPAGAWATSSSRWRQWSNTTARSTSSRPIGGQGASPGAGAGWPSSSSAASYPR